MITADEVRATKGRRRLAMLTAYDYPTALALDQAGLVINVMGSIVAGGGDGSRSGGFNIVIGNYSQFECFGIFRRHQTQKIIFIILTLHPNSYGKMFKNLQTFFFNTNFYTFSQILSDSKQLNVQRSNVYIQIFGNNSPMFKFIALIFCIIINCQFAIFIGKTFQTNIQTVEFCMI